MKFILDENISPNLAKMLDAFDPVNEVVHILEYLAPGTADVDLIGELSTWDPKPVLISGDGRILKNKVELSALKSADLTFFVLAKGWNNLSWEDWGWKSVRAWPKLALEAQKIRHPTVYEVSPGTLKIKRIGRTTEL